MCSLKTLSTAVECPLATSRVAHTDSSTYWRRLTNLSPQFSRYLHKIGKLCNYTLCDFASFLTLADPLVVGTAVQS